MITFVKNMRDWRPEFVYVHVTRLKSNLKIIVDWHRHTGTQLELAVTRRQMESTNAAATYYWHSVNWIWATPVSYNHSCKKQHGAEYTDSQRTLCC